MGKYLKVEYKGKNYYFDGSKWLDSNFLIVSTALALVLTANFRHLIDFDIDKIRGPADIEIFGGDLNILKEAFLKALSEDSSNDKYIAIISSIYRKLNQPLEALKYGSDDSNNEAVLASRAGAYCDIGELVKAEKNAKRAYGFNKNKKPSESQRAGLNYIRNVFSRIRQLRQGRN